MSNALLDKLSAGNEAIQETSVWLELAEVYGIASLFVGIFFCILGVPVEIYGGSLVFGFIHVAIMWCLKRGYISHFNASQVVISTAMIFISWDCLVTGGEASPFRTTFTIFPFLLLGRHNLKWTRIWIVLAMLCIVVTSLGARIFQMESKISAQVSALVDASLRLVLFCLGSVEAYKFNSLNHAMMEWLSTEKSSAQHATQAKSQFLAVMSHEIRTPLQGVIGWVDLLLSEPSFPKSDSARKQLTYLSQSSSMLKEVVSNILDFSKIEEGKQVLENTPFKPADTIAKLLAPLKPSPKVKIIKDIGKVPEICFGANLGIKQCLYNYISNAIKFTPEGSITISLNAKAKTDIGHGKEEGKQFILIFEVSDTGIGVAEKDQKNLFTAFQQADFSISRNYGGTGLGLAIVKGLANLMGGDAWCKSVVGVGSSFFFSAVVKPSTTIELEKFRKSLKEEKEKFKIEFPDDETRDRSKKKDPILIVDDNKMNHRFLTVTLSKLGLPYVEAWDGLEAIRMFKAQPLSVIFMDVHMPTMNGYEAAKQIRGLVACGGDKIPIIAITGDTIQSVDETSSEMGYEHLFSDIIQKPFTVESFTLCVKRWITGGGSNSRRGSYA